MVMHTVHSALWTCAALPHLCIRIWKCATLHIFLFFSVAAEEMLLSVDPVLAVTLVVDFLLARYVYF